MSELHWGIKSSLLSYVRGMADGTVTVEEPARLDDEGPCFPGEDLRFRGALALRGHGGMLNLTFRDPQIDDAGGWRLSVLDPYELETRLVIATIGKLDTDPDGTTRGTSVALTADGADLFFGPYTDGTALDDLAVTP